MKSFEATVAEIIAKTIAFEEVLEGLRQKLAANDYFETRLAFDAVDGRRQGLVRAGDLAAFIRRFPSQVPFRE
jgi:hypothetical protein